MRLPERIDITTFRAVLDQGRQRTVLACLSEDHNYRKQVEMIGQLAETFVGLMHFFVVTTEDLAIRRLLDIQGDPTFIGFSKGREVFRFLGHAEFEELAMHCRKLLDGNDDVRGIEAGESCRSGAR